MLPHKPRSETALRALGKSLVALAALACVGPAMAGQQGGNLEVQLLELELGGPDRFVLCDDADASGQCEAAEEESVQNIITGLGKRGCELALVGDPLVELTTAAGTPGIDENKGAIGDRDNKGTGCGQLENGDVLDLFFLGRAVVDSRVQFEAKQNVAAEIIFKRNDVEVGKRYVLSGNAVAPADFPPTGSPDLLLCNVGSADGNPDSGERDDCLLHLSRAGGAATGAPNPEPHHDQQSYRIRNDGALSLKAGSEFPFPEENRSAWTVVEFDGILNCGDSFSCAGNPDCIDSGVTGNRTEEETGDACTNPILFELEFDGREVLFNYLDTNNQNPGITLDVEWQSEATGRDPAAAPGTQFPIDPTILSYDPAGVACGAGSCSNDATACQSNDDCDPGNTCVLPVTESCVPLTLCLGTPIRRCSNDSSLGCREDADCGPGNRCRMEDLVAPSGGFPDLLPASGTVEYGCVCEEDVLYLGPGVCDELSGALAGTSCEDDSVCGAGGSCELFGRCDAASGVLAGDSCGDSADCVDGANAGTCVLGEELAVEQCLFFTGDARFKRGTKTF